MVSEQTIAHQSCAFSKKAIGNFVIYIDWFDNSGSNKQRFCRVNNQFEIWIAWNKNSSAKQ